MTPKLLTLFSVSVALSASSFSFVRSALGERAVPSASEERAQARTNDNAHPAFDSKLLTLLEAQEATRRTARRVALADPKSWQENRVKRAAAHRAQQAELWGSVVGSIDGQARLRMHAERMARLNRMLDLAEQQKAAALATRIQADIERELARHAHAMQLLQAAAGPR